MGDDEGVPEWARVFLGSRTSEPILDFLKANPEFDVNSTVDLRYAFRLTPIKALFHCCINPHLVIVLKELIARGLRLDTGYDNETPANLAMLHSDMNAMSVLIDAGATVTEQLLRHCCGVGGWNMLQFLLWQGQPSVSDAKRCLGDTRKGLYIEDCKKCDCFLRRYIADCKRRSATLAATLWVMTSYPPAIWRDLSEHVARRLADIPLEKFCV
jgi:hypothetical protein